MRKGTEMSKHNHSLYARCIFGMWFCWSEIAYVDAPHVACWLFARLSWGHSGGRVGVYGETGGGVEGFAEVRKAVVVGKRRHR
jgi:hypothetical protein